VEGRILKDIKSEIILGSFLLGFSLFIRAIIPFQVGDMEIAPGLTTKTIPLITCYLLIILSLFYLLSNVMLYLRSYRRVKIEIEKKSEEKLLMKMGITLVIILGYIILFRQFGFLYPTMIFSVGLSFYLGNRLWYTFGIIGIAIPLIIFFIFNRLLYVPL